MRSCQIGSVCLLLSLILMIVPTLSGCSSVGEKDITFHDLTMTVDAGFEWVPVNEEDIATYTSVSRVQITLHRTSFLTLSGIDFTAPALITIEEFREMIIESNGHDATLCDADGTPAFVYEFEGSNQYGSEMYKSLCCVFKSDSAFWCVYFDVPILVYDQWKAQFYEWAKTVRFAESDPGVYVPE